MPQGWRNYGRRGDDAYRIALFTIIYNQYPQHKYRHKYITSMALRPSVRPLGTPHQPSSPCGWGREGGNRFQGLQPRLSPGRRSIRPLGVTVFVSFSSLISHDIISIPYHCLKYTLAWRYAHSVRPLVSPSLPPHAPRGSGEGVSFQGLQTPYPPGVGVTRPVGGSDISLPMPHKCWHFIIIYPKSFRRYLPPLPPPLLANRETGSVTSGHRSAAS